MSTPIINEELFKLYSPVTGNTDLKEFVPYLSIAQELYISPILGKRLITELKSQINSNTISETNSSLILKIAPALSFWTVYQGLPFHWASIVNKGITIRESENSKGININDVAQLRQWVRNDAEIFNNILIEYLCVEQDKFKLWKPDKNYCSACEDNSTFDSGFFFSKQ